MTLCLVSGNRPGRSQPSLDFYNDKAKGMRGFTQCYSLYVHFTLPTLRALQGGESLPPLTLPPTHLRDTFRRNNAGDCLYRVVQGQSHLARNPWLLIQNIFSCDHSLFSEQRIEVDRELSGPLQSVVRLLRIGVNASAIHPHSIARFKRYERPPPTSPLPLR